MKTIQLKDILAISGKGGLFKFVAQARNGIVVESLEEHKRHVAPATARVSSLEDIAIFTMDEEVPLADIFYMIQEKSEGKETISHKAPAEELKSRFRELVPEYDEDRVYVSDIKKVFQWYNQLNEHEMLEVIEKEEDKEGEDDKKEQAGDQKKQGGDQKKQTGNQKKQSSEKAAAKPENKKKDPK